MSGYLLVTGVPKDPEKLAAYGAVAGPTMEPYGGEFVVGGPAEALAGDDAPFAALVRFPSKEKAKQWYNSPEYQSLIPLREEGIQSRILLLEVPG